MRRFQTTIFLAALALGILCFSLLSPSVARADVFLLRNGGRLEGEQLNPDRVKEDPYQIQLTSGVKLALAGTQVQRVMPKNDALKQYEDLLPKVPNTVAGHWEMAEWCKDAGLSSQRKFHLEKVIALDPEHAPSRLALGYSKASGAWLKPEEFMRRQGYVLHRGEWKLPQQVEIESSSRTWDVAERDWRRKIKTWTSQLDGRRKDEAWASLKEIRDPAATDPITEVLAETSWSREVRLLMLEIVQQLPPHSATGTLIQISLNDKDEDLRDRCLTILAKQDVTAALIAFTKELKSKDNAKVNRAGYCLQRLGAPQATAALIEALTTSHKFQIAPGSGGGGQMGGTFGSGAGSDGFGGGVGGDSGGGLGGLGGMSMGGKKPTMIKKDLNNSAVLAALTSLHNGVNFGYDQAAWKRWYIQAKTTVDVNLRRSE